VKNNGGVTAVRILADYRRLAVVRHSTVQSQFPVAEEFFGEQFTVLRSKLRKVIYIIFNPVLCRNVR
jgi:hypothetical protein